MVKIKFGRSSRATGARDETVANDTQPVKSDNDEHSRTSKGTTMITTIVSDDRHQTNNVSANKENKQRKHPALRLFHFSSFTSSSSNPSQPKPTEFQTSSSSSSATSKQRGGTIDPTTSTSGTATKKGRVKYSKSGHRDSSSSRLVSTRSSSGTHSKSTPPTRETTSDNQLSTTNSSNKQALSQSETVVTDSDGIAYIECPLCILLVEFKSTPDLLTCSHRACLECMQRYLKTEINHSRLKITCPICSEPLQQRVIRDILRDDKFYFKYESFMLRKVLAAEPDARWCPAPDCGYAVLATGCASCPRLVCGRDGCKTEFCYHCKQEWHPNQTCSAASIQRNKRSGFVLNAFKINEMIPVEDDQVDSGGGDSDGAILEGDNSAKSDGMRGSSKASRTRSATSATPANSSSLRPEDIKECPVCSSRIVKMNDGSCNHMTCSICETDFCWLCMKEISDLHYFSPSGCTFWGKKPWSRKKKLLWRLGMLVGAPICIVAIAGIAVPAIVIGIPVWAARKLHNRMENKQFSSYRKNAIITGGVLLSFIVSPIISAMALAVGIPILLGYVYGVVPLSLCRSSGGCLSSNPSVEDLSFTQNQQSSTSTSVVNQARDQLQRMQLQSAQQEFKRQQFKSEQQQQKSRQNKPQPTTSSSVDQTTPPPYSDIVSVDAVTNDKLEVGNNHHGGSSIGEPSMYMSNISLETNSIGNVTNIAERCSRNSASGAGACGVSAAGCEDQESESNIALSGSALSHKADDIQSTRALAGSIVSRQSGGYALIPADKENPQGWCRSM